MNRAKTHCIHGHEFTEENTMWFGPDKRLRYCRTCKRDASRITARKQRVKRKTAALERVRAVYA